MVFFAFIYGICELARAMFLWNTLAAATRVAARAAAVTDFRNDVAMEGVRQHAVFRSSPGRLTLGGEISDSYIRIAYLRADAQTAVNPSLTCPMQNIIDCATNPNGNNCIRFVQVRLCGPGAGCSQVSYTPMIASALPYVGGLKFPTFETVTPAGSFGHRAGAASTCP
jgi:hypothetical protein